MPGYRVFPPENQEAFPHPTDCENAFQHLLRLQAFKPATVWKIVGERVFAFLSRNDSIGVWVERATGPFCRAISPIAERKECEPNGVRSPCARLGDRLPPRTAKWAVPPGPTASFRLSSPARCEHSVASATKMILGWLAVQINMQPFGLVGASFRACERRSGKPPFVAPVAMRVWLHGFGCSAPARREGLCPTLRPARGGEGQLLSASPPTLRLGYLCWQANSIEERSLMAESRRVLRP